LLCFAFVVVDVVVILDAAIVVDAAVASVGAVATAVIVIVAVRGSYSLFIVKCTNFVRKPLNLSRSHFVCVDSGDK